MAHHKGQIIVKVENFVAACFIRSCDKKEPFAVDPAGKKCKPSDDFLKRGIVAKALVKSKIYRKTVDFIGGIRKGSFKAFQKAVEHGMVLKSD